MVCPSITALTCTTDPGIRIGGCAVPVYLKGARTRLGLLAFDMEYSPPFQNSGRVAPAGDGNKCNKDQLCSCLNLRWAPTIDTCKGE